MWIWLILSMWLLLSIRLVFINFIDLTFLYLIMNIIDLVIFIWSIRPTRLIQTLYSIGPFNHFNQSSINCKPGQFKLIWPNDWIVLKIWFPLKSTWSLNLIQYLFQFDTKKYILVDQKLYFWPDINQDCVTICQWQMVLTKDLQRHCHIYVCEQLTNDNGQRGIV